MASHGTSGTTMDRGSVERFMASRRIAIAGVSRSGRGFGNAVLKDLRGKGYEVRVVHPEAAQIAGEPCSPSLELLAGAVDALMLITPPSSTETLVRQAAAAGIRRVWMQPGAESEDAIRYCEEEGIEAVHGLCILMYAEPAMWMHRAHRFVRHLAHTAP
jgi:uncharacterized protein